MFLLDLTYEVFVLGGFFLLLENLFVTILLVDYGFSRRLRRCEWFCADSFSFGLRGEMVGVQKAFETGFDLGDGGDDGLGD